MATPSTDRDPNRINLSWLVRLRWGAATGQLGTIAIVALVMRLPLPLLPLFGLVAFAAVSNVACSAWLRAGRPVGPRLLAAVMALDVLTLTGLLLLSGGASNPFSFLYLVYIALAAVVLSAAWTWALVALAAVCSGLLFLGGSLFPEPDTHSHAHHMQMHLQGMWIAFLVAAAFIVHFVSRVRRALSDRERDLEAERAAAARNERLTSLATLAAGAAHELATPLGTIAMAAGELDRGLGRRDVDPDVLADVRLIREQVARCRGILDQMAAEAGTPRADDPRLLPTAAIVEGALAELPARTQIEVRIEPPAERLAIAAPQRALAQALRGLAKNAAEASPEGARVALVARAVGSTLELEIDDRGAGMTAETLARAGEPFFTTKPAGSGMGLGLFLARSVIERLGGELTLESKPGQGTRARVRLPASATT